MSRLQPDEWILTFFFDGENNEGSIFSTTPGHYQLSHAKAE